MAGLATAGVVSIALLEIFLALVRPEGGGLGVLQIVAPHLALLGVIAAVVGLVRPNPAWGLACAALLVVIGMRFGPEWISLPGVRADAGASPFVVVTWNVEIESRRAADTVELLAAHPADLIALQELQPQVARAIEADPRLTARYPYRALVPDESVFGLGLLSRVPISDARIALRPAVQEATIEVDGRAVAVINAHPMHADIDMFGESPVPTGLDVDSRNADLVTIRALIDDARRSTGSVILVGDLNTASSEPAHDRFVAGLRDVHADAGLGPGWTWRPRRLEFLGIGLIRIDYVIVTPEIAADGIRETCPAAGDHCLVAAEVTIPSAR